LAELAAIMRPKQATKANRSLARGGTRDPAEGKSSDHLYLQIARALKKEIVEGVYPVGSQLPTEDELCKRFSCSRYTVREALRRLREDGLVSSRPRAGTLVGRFLCAGCVVDQRPGVFGGRYALRHRLHGNAAHRRQARRMDRTGQG
jgi:DNA-binding transcriptional MocR family regulator